MNDDKYVVKRYFQYDGTPCDTVLSVPLPHDEALKRLQLFQEQYQSNQYVIERWRE